jgi:preprotein translocase subunit YajC
MILPALRSLIQAAAPATDAAPAGAPPPASESPFGGMWVPLLLCMAVFYFVMIGPERKQRKKRESMLANLQKGTKVMTTGGMYGTVMQIADQTVTLQIADGVRVRYALSAIQSVLDEETAPEKDAAKS